MNILYFPYSVEIYTNVVLQYEYYEPSEDGLSKKQGLEMILLDNSFKFTHKRYDYIFTLNKIERHTSIFSSLFKKPEVEYFYVLESTDLGDSYDTRMN